MGSKRKGVCDLPSTSEGDEGSVRRKRPIRKTFRIYSTEYVTSENREEKKRVKIALDVNTTEREIREILIRELPQLRGKGFKFFTKDEAGKWYFCPCSLQCEGKDHSAEWNGRNIPQAAKSNRAVYILIESTTVEETRSGGVQNDAPTSPVPSDSQLRGSVGQYSSNPLNQKEGRITKTYQSVNCPNLSLSGLEHQENTTARPLSVYHGNTDLNQWPPQLTQPTQPSQEQTLSKPEYEKVKDGGWVTEEKDGEGEVRTDKGDEEMQTDVCNNDVASTSENVSPQMYFESGYDTFPSENNALVLVDPANSVLDEAPQTFFVNNLPLLDTNLNGTSLHPAPTEFMQIFQDFPRTPLEIEEIVPDRGNVAGGQTFYLSLAEACTIHDIEVQFGPSITTVERCGNKDFKGIVPPYPEADVVQVYMVNNRLERMSNFKPFEYIDPDKAKEDFVKKDINSRKDFEEMLFLLSKKVGKIDLSSNETKDSQGTNKPGGGKTQALSLLYMIANTAAMLNAIDFYRVIFSTQAGHCVFKSGKDAQTPLEEIARENGHEELAHLLQQKHLMYQDDENESDDEVDWKELARAIEKYQTLMGQTAEKKSIPSTSSSEQIQGYLGDGESSTSLSSLHLLDVEGCTESTFEDQQATLESMCGEEPNTPQSTAVEDCPESTFEEQQTTPEATCEEEPDTCQTIGRIAIRDGMSDTDTINTISSSEQLRMNKAHQVKESQSSIGEKNELANIHVNPLHLVVSGPIIMKSFQMDKFAPKEISRLRRKLGSFDAAKMNPSALYPDGDQAIYNLMERLDTPPELDFLEKLKQDSTRGLNAQKGSQHPETAEKELCDAKRKGATVMKTESITSLCSSLHSRVESGVEIATLAGSESNISLEEQSTEVEISQDARFFDERKSACLSFLRTRRLACACLLTSMLSILVCLAAIFTLRASTKTQTSTTTPTTAVETMTTSRQACSNGLLTILCEGVTDLNAVHELRWKINFPDAGWNEFAYCGKSGLNCVVTRPELPEGIKVVEVSNRSVNIQRVAKSNTSGFAQIMGQVLYSDNSRTSHVYKINFTAKCVRIHEHRDLNLTKILQSFVQCERAVDIEWYSINGSKFVHCSTCQDCKKISEVNREHVFWSRLKVTRGSLLLTAIQGSDDGRTIRVKVHMKASGKSAGRDVEANMESAHMYTIWIFVNISRPPVPEKENKSLCGSPPKVCRVGANFPCKPEQIHWNTTVGKRPKCFDCPDCLPGREPSIPCGTSVYEWPEIHCVLCELGKTYSDKDDTSHCKTCTICSKGKAVKNNCTLTTDTECDNRCRSGFYTVPLISGCFPCTRCCGDGKDEFAAECANNEKMCRLRYTPCTRFQTTPSKPTKRNYGTSNTSPAVKKAGERTTMDVNEEEEKSVSGELSISITPSPASDNEMGKVEIVESEKRDGISIVLILLIITVALSMVSLISIAVKRAMPVGNMLQSSREQDSNNEGCNISQGGKPPLPHSSAQSSHDSSTPLFNQSEPPQPNGSASPQHMSSTPVQTNGALSSQPNGSESPEPERSTSLHSSVSSQPDGCALTYSNKYTATAAAAQSNQSAQEQVKSHPGDVTLEELEEKHFPVFERMCKDLNSKRPGERWDFERLASCYDKISLTDRNALKNEFQNGGGNPSDTLMSHIKTKYPDHTLRHLVRNLQSIGRDDIALRLMPYTLRKPSSTQGY